MDSDTGDPTRQAPAPPRRLSAPKAPDRRPQATLDGAESPEATDDAVQSLTSSKALLKPADSEAGDDGGAVDEAAEESDAPCLMFLAICVLQVLANFDNGVLPSVLSAIQAELGLGYDELGLLGALVYVGLVASCPISGYLLTSCGSPRLVLVGSVVLNAGALLLFAAAPAAPFLLVARALIGLSQAPIFIYAPVWVDQFAPPSRLTLWISLLQANVAIGIMLGYVFGGISVIGGNVGGWRVPLYTQAALMLPFAVVYLLAPERWVSGVGKLKELAEEAEMDDEEAGSEASPSSGTAADSIDASGDSITLCEGTAALLCNGIFVLLTAGLTGLYFVVTGIQFWVSDYLVGDIGADPGAVVAGFAVTSLTGPTLGVFFGGWLVDRMGGYKDESGQSAFVTLRVCCLFGIGAAVSAVPAAIVRDFWGVMVSVWFVLFFGGALLPAVTGVAIAAVPPQLRSVGNALSLLMYNLLGYAAAPFVCGLIASAVGIAWGFRVVMFASFVAVVPIAVASCVARPSALDPTLQELPSEDVDAPKQGGSVESPMRSGSSLVAVEEGDDDDNDNDDDDDGDDDDQEEEAAEPSHVAVTVGGDAALTSVSQSAIPTAITEASRGGRAPSLQARSRRGTVVDVVISALAYGIGVPDPNAPLARLGSAAGSATSRAHAVGRLSSSSSSASSSSSLHARRPRRLSAFHLTPSLAPVPTKAASSSEEAAAGVSASLRRRSHAPTKSKRRLVKQHNSEKDPASAAPQRAHQCPHPRRRVSGMVAVLGDISVHASRGRALTSFFHTRHMFDPALQQVEEEPSTTPVPQQHRARPRRSLSARAGATQQTQSSSSQARMGRAASDGMVV